MRHSPARVVCIAICATLFCVNGFARADDAAPPKPSDAAAGMLDAMREKGIISQAEYEDLYKRQAIYEMEQREASSLPGWLKEWTFGGDAGVRFDQINYGGSIHVDKPLSSTGNPPADFVNGTATAKNNRMRLRLRLGAERQIGEDFLVGFRIATASGSTFGGNSTVSGVNFTRTFATDPRSSWVTMGSDFAPAGIGVDRVYISWAPHLVEGFSITAGKMQNSFVSPEFSGDFLVWDNDISTEGLQTKYTYRLFDERAWVTVRAAYLIVDQVSSATLISSCTAGDTSCPTGFPNIDEKDPFMYAGQVDFGGDITPWMRAGARVSYYQLRDINARTAAAMEDLGNGGAAIENNPLFRDSADPSIQTNGASRGLAQEIVYDVFAKFTPFEGWSVTPWFQLTHMFDAGSEDYGYGTGFDVLAPTNTKLTFMYASMPRNGTFALFTDSDFFDGMVNARGWGVTLAQAFNRWTTLRATYLSSTERSGTCQNASTQPLLCDSSVWVAPGNLASFRKQILDRDRILVDLLVKF
jgi:hypothetical protein